MNSKRKMEIINSIKKEIDNWQVAIASLPHQSSIETIAQTAAFNSSLHLIFTDAANRPYFYAGMDQICCYLSESYQGTISYHANTFFWKGECSLGNIFDIIYSFNKCSVLKFQVNPEDFAEMINDIQPCFNQNIFLENHSKTACCYIGRKEFCNTLKQKLSGKTFLCGNFWCWIGTSNLDRVKSIIMLKEKNLS